MRHIDVFSREYRNVPNFYGGVEAWPGLLFKQHETGCLFMDNLKQLPYHDLFWRNGANEAFRRWNAQVRPIPVPVDLAEPIPYEGHSWPRLEQKPEEFGWWIRLLLSNNVRSLLTIGAMCGGAEWHIARAFREQGRDIQITAIDLGGRQELEGTLYDAQTRFEQSIRLVVGSSSSTETRRLLAENYEAVFIDADHSYFASREDFLLAKSLAPRLIGFHDIVDSDWHASERCCVSRLWAELVQEHQTEQQASGEWGGIGVVRL